MEKYDLELFTNDDYEFVYLLKKESYLKYVIECFGKWDEEEQRKRFDEFVSQNKDNLYIIKMNNQKIGFYNDYVDGKNYEIRNICINKEYQNKGIGSSILKKKIKEYQKYTIKVQYFKQNPVGDLYKKLGLKNNGETTYHYQMIMYPKRKYYWVLYFLSIILFLVFVGIVINDYQNYNFLTNSAPFRAILYIRILELLLPSLLLGLFGYFLYNKSSKN